MGAGRARGWTPGRAEGTPRMPPDALQTRFGHVSAHGPYPSMVRIADRAALHIARCGAISTIWFGAIILGFCQVVLTADLRWLVADYGHLSVVCPWFGADYPLLAAW